MAKKQKPKFGLKSLNIAHLSMILSIAIIAALMLMIGVFAQSADVPAQAELGDPDCFWSDGPDSELYVPSGKTCTIDADTSAKNLAGWTDYAVIVYAGGTLEIVADSANTELTVDGDMYVMGTVNIGDGNPSAYNNSITTATTLGNGDIYVRGSGTFNALVNTGAGENYFVANNNMYIGGPDDSSLAQLNMNDSGTEHFVDEILESYDDVNLNAGKLNVNSLKIKRPIAQTSTFDVASGTTLTIVDYHACTYPDASAGTCIMQVGYDYGSFGAGDAIMTVAGILNIGAGSAVDRSIFIGNTGYDGKLAITTTGEMYVNETTASFGGPGPFDDPSNYFGVFSDGTYGLDVEGVVETGMFLRNAGGVIEVDSPTNTGSLLAEQGFQQYATSTVPNLVVGQDDKFKVLGEADIDYAAEVSGNFETTQCLLVTNPEPSFVVTGFANVDINTDVDLTCAITGGNDVGLTVEGSGTDMTIADGATHDFDVNRVMTVDDGAYVDINGEITVTRALNVYGSGTIVEISDTGSDAVDVFDLRVSQNNVTTTDDTTLTIEASGSLYINGGILIGDTTASTNKAIIDVYGDLSVNPSSNSGFEVYQYGQLLVRSGGEVNADADDGGGNYFIVYGGEMDVYGTVNINGTNDQEMWIVNYGTNEPDVVVYNGGLIDSKATPASNEGLDYDSGDITIEYGGQMLFDDQIIIANAAGDDMMIYGELEGTEQILVNSAANDGNNNVRESGEMRVVGTNSNINVYSDLGLTGKLNAFNGNSNITIYNGAVVGGDGLGDDSYSYILARDLDIQSGGSIDVSEFQTCTTAPPGPMGGGTYGGSYGGEGQGGNTETYGAVKYTTAPVFPGTANPVGMFGYNDGTGGTPNALCGGAIYIEVNRDITINGVIRANGESNPDDDEGAGSGGLIVINHNIGHADTDADFTGSANIEAGGGNGDGTTNSYGGGGGRIIIDSILFEEPDDTETGEPHYKYTGGVYAIGGESNNGSGDYAASGTIVYLGDDNNPNGTLIVDQGNRSLGTSGKETNITNTGDYVFDRIEARLMAVITFDAAPATDPISCFTDSTSQTPTGLTSCPNTHDKPDTLYINSTYPGAQSGDEPWFGSPVTVSDLTPEFSMIYRNPQEAAQTGDYVLIEVDDNSDFSSPLWSASDANNPVDITNTGEASRTEDITYGGAALSPATGYYVRAAFSDATGSTRGLWTHKDMGNHYNFETDSGYMEISNSCSDVITVETGGATPLKYPSGLYGSGTCEFTITATDGAWNLYYVKASPGLSLNDGTGTYVWSEIDNAGGDCEIDTTGSTPEEEYGFNIANLTGVLLTTAIVQANSDCSLICTTGEYDESDCMFNIDDYASWATSMIIDGNGSTPSSETFDLVIHANIDAGTEPETYELNTSMVISDSP